jgi:hypothetical protein
VSLRAGGALSPAAIKAERARDGAAVERIVTELIEALAGVGANSITWVEA